MYVIVEMQGQQFKVEKGMKLFIHYTGAEGGAELEFDKVMLIDNEGKVTIGAPVIEGAKVIAEVVSPIVRGEKVLIFHKKRRKGYRKLNGHRQNFTEILVKDIVVA
ncbi:MAG: 50S ribosomal protein L21 [Bacteroidales bacterium]|nr:50S ribosomal protein L21 [Bacteroidales bacterium]